MGKREDAGNCGQGQGQQVSLLNAVRIRKPGNNSNLILLAIEDITERKRVEVAALFLASIVGSSDDAIIGKTLDGIIQSWNPAAVQMFGYTAEQAVGRPINLIIPADRADEELRILARLRAGERIEHFDTIRVRSDGQHIPVSLTISPIKDGAGRIIGASKIARDITDRKKAEVAVQTVTEHLKTGSPANLVKPPPWAENWRS